MPDFPIRRGSANSDAARLQGLLNRRGALLAEDGRFGGATEQALCEAQAAFGLPETGECDAATWAGLEALPEPSSLLPTRGLTFIGREEVSSRERYDSLYHRPCWPGGESGITIGIGYDLRFADSAQFARDWQAHLSPAAYAALLPWLGRQGSRRDAEALRANSVPYSGAWMVFVASTIPLYVRRTTQATAFGQGYDALPGLCKSALVSLVYNRGAGLDGERRIEMRAIRDLIAAGALDAVPAQIEAMKRLWPDVQGLRDRRDREARLWREGLAGS
jgi:hypothetical protein